MGDLISRSRLKEELKSWAWIITKPKYYHREDADFVIDAQAAVDAMEVVRCEKCLYRSQYANKDGLYRCGGILTENEDLILMVKPDFFCAYGERRGKCSVMI